MSKTVALSIFLSLFFFPFINAQCPDVEVEITQECSFDSSEVRLYINIDDREYPYQISWEGEGVQGEETFPYWSGTFNLPFAPNYQITIEDNNGCLDTFYHETSPIVHNFELEIINKTNATLCEGGSAQILPIGGNPPFHILRSDGTPGPEFPDTIFIEDLEPVTFQIQIVDAMGCSNVMFLSILLDNSEDIMTQVGVNNSSCGVCNGSVLIGTNGVNSPYLVDGELYNDDILIENLCAGVYNFQITDSTGCNQSVFIAIGSDNGPNFTSFEMTPSSCIYSEDGSFSFEIEGTPPFLYSWSGPNGFTMTTNSSELNNLIAGEYTVTITDGNGCLNLASFELETESGEVILETSHTHLTCTSPGTISFDLVEGENGPYNSIITNEDGLSFSGNFLPIGTYYACVIDMNGCWNICDTIIITNADLAMELNSNFANCENSGGMAIATITDTIITPSFEWSNGQTGDTLSNVAAGWYSVTVTDEEQDCQTHQNVEVKLDPSCYVHISGSVYLDSETPDCIEDPATIPAEFVLVELSNGSMDFTDENGYYEFQEEAGSYEVTINLENTIYDPICVDPINITSLDFGDHAENNNFWLKYAEVQDLAVQLFTSAARPGFDQTVIAFVYNLGNTPTSGTLSFTHDSLQSFVSSVPSGYTYDETNSTVIWELGEIQPGAFERFNIQLNLPANTPLGTLIDYRLAVDPIDSDFYPTNNILEKQLIVVGSYDPNDKQVSPTGEEEEGFITRNDSLLTYQIRFQNTGTDTAFTVLVLDEIEEDLDINSVRPGPSSHPYKLNILDGNILEFKFENIMLPDSFVNEPASNGYVLFDIKTKKDLPWETKIENTAAIYFDFNDPIITNTVTNTLRLPPVNVKNLEDSNLSLKLSPNPSSDLSILKFELEKSTQVDLALYDTRGRLIRQYLKEEALQSGLHQVRFEESNLSEGIYFVVLKTAEGKMEMEKWVKVK